MSDRGRSRGRTASPATGAWWPRAAPTRRDQPLADPLARSDDACYRIGEPLAPADGEDRYAAPSVPSKPSRSPEADSSGSSEARDTPRRRRRRRGVLVALALSVVIVLGWVGLRVLVVRGVVVSGTHQLSARQVVAAAAVPPGTPLVRVDAAEVRARVARIPQVEAVRVRRHWSGTLDIAVTERVPRAAIGQDGRYVLVDRHGVVVATVADRPTDMPMIVVGGPVAGNPAVAGAVSVVEALPRWILGRLVEVSAAQPDAITLRLRSGARATVTVMWGGPERAVDKGRILAALVRDAPTARSYDVSSPDVVSATR